MTDLHTRSSRYGVHVRHTLGEAERVDVNGSANQLVAHRRRTVCLPVGALGCDILVQWVPRHSLHVVLVLPHRVHAFTCPSAPCRYVLKRVLDSPVPAFQILAVLSVDPAIKNSLSGDQARSYTCFVVTLPRSAFHSRTDRAEEDALQDSLGPPMFLVHHVFVGRLPESSLRLIRRYP